jgi:hypothetical protein
VRPAPEPEPEPKPGLATIDVAIALACAAFVLLHLRLDLLVADTTPTGGDLAGHVLGPALMRGHLFEHGFLASWSNDWFGGFPIYRFYPPLPALAVVVLDTVLPYGTSIKLLVALPLVAMPIVAWYLGRAARLPLPGPALMALASLLFLFDSSNVKAGGTIAATLIGEYGNALGITLGLLALARFTADVNRDRRGPTAGLIGAAAALCHPFGAAVVGLGLIAFAASELIFDRDRWRAVLVHLGGTLGLTVLISAFWYLPFFAFRLYTNDLNNQPVGPLGVLFPLPWPITLLLVGFALVGVYDAVVRRRAAIVGVAVTGALFALWTAVAPAGMLWNARLAPVWNLALVLVAAAGVAATLSAARERLHDRGDERDGRRLAAWAPVALALVVFAALAWDMGTLPGTTRETELVDGREVTVETHWIVGPDHEPSPVPLFARTAFGGFERDVHYPEYKKLIATMKRLAGEHGCGRLMSEFDPKGTYGSTYGEALLPYWTDGCITTITGRENDSSPTSAYSLVAESALSNVFSAYEPGLPYEGMSPRRGYQYLREMGARYYLARSPEAVANARKIGSLEQIAKVGDAVVFLVPDPKIVLPLSAEPIVVDGADDGANRWEEVGLSWFKNADEAAIRVAPSGPDKWQRLGAGEPRLRQLVYSNVTRTRVTDDSISFHIDDLYRPILVRVSAFPWWQARNAEGPYRVTPNWMVVVPLAHDVSLVQRTQTVEWVGVVLTIGGLLLAVGMAFRERARRRKALR